MLEFGLSQEDSIIVGGDFNCPLNPLPDKKGGIWIPCFGVIHEGLQEQFPRSAEFYLESKITLHVLQACKLDLLVDVVSSF